MRGLVLGLLVLSGCVGPLVPVRKIDISERAALEAMPVVKRATLDPKSYRVLGAVEGHSCQNKTWDPYPSQQDALDQLKAAARELGGNAVASVRCSQRGTSMGTNCWNLISCSGEALEVSSTAPAAIESSPVERI